MICEGWLWPRPWDGLPTPGRVAVEGGEIGAVKLGGDAPAAMSGPSFPPTEAPPSHSGRPLAPESLPAEALLWLPAPINAHDHGRGLSPLSYGAPDDRLEPWLWDLWRAPATDPYLTHLVAFGRMARAGVAGVVHNHIQTTPCIVSEAQAVARAAGDVGLRLAFVVPLIDRNLAGYDGGAAVRRALSPADATALERAQAQPPIAEQVARVAEVAEAIDGPLVRTQYGPPGPHWTSPEGAALIGEASARDGRRVHIHLLETLPQRRWMDAEHPAGAQTYFATAGLLNDRLTLAHGVHLRPAEAEAFARAGATLAINASSNLRLASGVVDGALLRAAGLRLGIGLDGMALDDDADMLREIRLAATLLALPDGRRSPALCAAFSDGRVALGGTAHPGLAPGAPADLLALSRDALAGDRMDDAPETLAALAAGRWRRDAVRALIVAGRRIVADGELTSVDLPAAEAELQAAARRARESSAPPAWIGAARATQA